MRRQQKVFSTYNEETDGFDCLVLLLGECPACGQPLWIEQGLTVKACEDHAEAHP